MLLIHPLDFLTVVAIVGVIVGLLWLTWQTYKELSIDSGELNNERSAEE